MRAKIRRLVADLLARVIATTLPALMKQKRYFRLWEASGFHVFHVHFYEPVPDTRTLPDELWSKPSQLVGVDLNETAQLELLDQFVACFKTEYDSFPANKTSAPNQYYVHNAGFEEVDGEILYCMIRHFKPRTILEIGSGHSTYLAAQAALKNQAATGTECDLIAIEPYPSDALRQGFPGLTKLVTKKVQEIPLSEFEKLQENDLLFIDSSHVLAIGSDVQYEYLEILPRLKKGVIIHLHDIFLPLEYPRDWVLKEYRFWTEQYLLQAFLSFNQSFEVLWAGSYMHVKHPDQLEAAFRNYRRDKGPASFWLRRVR